MSIKLFRTSPEEIESIFRPDKVYYRNETLDYSSLHGDNISLNVNNTIEKNSNQLPMLSPYWVFDY